MKTKAKGFCEKGLKLISLGKYQTTFYSEKTGSTFFSSVLGGIVTLLLLLLIGDAIVLQLV